MDGVINVLKPPGMTSHDVVSRLRKILKTKKIGHTGTLDPDAVGVLPICVGKATRLVEYLTGTKKTYRALLCFGAETDTQDASGQVVKRTELPNLSGEEFAQVLRSFLGKNFQIPPMFSAIKKNGKPLYLLARQGVEVARKPREIEIHNIELLAYDSSQALIEVTCSKGTYIRTLCQDIGRKVESGAYLGFLIRTQSGNFHINDSFCLEEIKSLKTETFLISPAQAIDFPELYFTKDLLFAIGNGNKVPSPFQEKTETDEKYKVLDEQGNLLAIGKIEKGYFQPEKVFR